MANRPSFLPLHTLVCSLGILAGGLASGTAGAGSYNQGDNPYRLHVDSREYRLRLPGDEEAGSAARPARATRRAPAAVARLIEHQARARGLDPALVHAVVRAESAYRPEAVSPKGAVGLMQVMPATGRRFGEIDLSSPESNLRAGTAYLSHLLRVFGDIPLALAAYNAGEGAVLRHGNRIPPYPETRAYVRAVLSSYGSDRLAAAVQRAPAAPRFYGPGMWLDRRTLPSYRLRLERGIIGAI